MSKKYKFNKNITTRYESRIGTDGMYFLFNTQSGEFWTGNTSSYVLLNNFRYKISIEKAIKESLEYFEVDKISLETTLNQMIEDLVKKGFIDEYDGE